jgi:hypothetical protein
MAWLLCRCEKPGALQNRPQIHADICLFPQHRADADLLPLYRADRQRIPHGCGGVLLRRFLYPHSPLHQLPVWRILCADQRAANTRRGNGIPNRQYLLSGAYLHSGYVHPRRDFSRNRTVPGAACGGCTFSATGVLLYMRSSKRLLNNQ